jgi:hypothetical protein
MAKITNWLKRPRNGLVAGALTLATITGTYMGNEGGLPPFYTVKSGTSYGINLGFVTEFREGAKHYGANVSWGTFFEGGELNGANLSLVSCTSSKNNHPDVRESKTNGLEFEMLSLDEEGYHRINGLQLGIINQNCGGTNAQIGLYNSAGKEGHMSRGVLFNFHKNKDEPIDGY